MTHAPFAHVVRHAFHESRHLAPVGRGKSPLVGFMAGFLFGPLGVGFALRSFMDFVITLGLVLLGSIFTAGVGAPVFWCLCGAWAYTRIKQSNTPAPAPAPGTTPASA